MAALLTFAPAATASSSSSAICQIEVGVSASESGRIVQRGAGTARCIGRINGQRIDPGVGYAFLRGGLRTAADGCTPVLSSGKVRILTRRVFDFSPNPNLAIGGSWAATGGYGALTTLAGTGSAGGDDVELLGDAVWRAAGDGCPPGSPGTLRLDLVID